MILFTNKHHIAFQIDDKNFDRVEPFTWRLAYGYPTTTIGGRHIFLHLFLFGYAAPGLEWDHINHDQLDNRRINLRQVTRSFNARNTRLWRNNSSGVKGVCFIPYKNHWTWYITVNGQRQQGYTKTFEEAVMYRKNAEISLRYFDDKT